MPTPERQTRNAGKIPKWTRVQWEAMTRPTDGSEPMTDRMIADMITAGLPYGQSVSPQAVTAARTRAQARPAGVRGKGWVWLNEHFWFPLKPYDYSHDLAVTYMLARQEAHKRRMGRELSPADALLLRQKRAELAALPDPKDNVGTKRWVLCYDPDRTPARARMFIHPWHPDDGGDGAVVCQRHNPAKASKMVG